MKTIDSTGLELCRMQARIFKDSVRYTKCSSPVFLRRYMNSHVAIRMDKLAYLFGSDSSFSVFEEIEEQFGPSEYGTIKYSEDEIYWIGYLYRYWCYTSQKPSRQIYQIIKPKELRHLYPVYHTMDCAKAIQRIMEAKGIEDVDKITEGVRIYRKIMEKDS